MLITEHFISLDKTTLLDFHNVALHDLGIFKINVSVAFTPRLILYVFCCCCFLTCFLWLLMCSQTHSER